MTPTPLFRPRSISVSKRVFWALSVVSKGLIGDGPVVAELTSDGIADTLLTEAIETKWPGLLERHASRERFDLDAVKAVAEAHAKKGAE